MDWTDVQGRPKLISARVGLLCLHRAGLIDLPAPSRGNRNGQWLVHGPQVWLEPIPVTAKLRELTGLRLEPVADQRASRLWNGLIDRYHSLGYKPLPGAQLRYLIQWGGGVLGAIGFGAAAWKVAARDTWIGWERGEREAHLGRVLNNARFLLLPWVQVKNLASKILVLAARRVAQDFPARYGEPVVLLETFVETPRFARHLLPGREPVVSGRDQRAWQARSPPPRGPTAQGGLCLPAARGLSHRAGGGGMSALAAECAGIQLGDQRLNRRADACWRNSATNPP